MKKPKSATRKSNATNQSQLQIAFKNGSVLRQDDIAQANLQLVAKAFSDYVSGVNKQYYFQQLGSIAGPAGKGKGWLVIDFREVATLSAIFV